MDDFQRINAPRVEKLIAALGVIAKSAKSNRAEPDAVAALLAPLQPALEALGIDGSRTLRGQSVPENSVMLGDPAPPEVRTRSMVRDDEWEAALEAITTMHYHRAPQLVTAIPVALRGAVITQLVDDLAERAK